VLRVLEWVRGLERARVPGLGLERVLERALGWVWVLERARVPGLGLEQVLGPHRPQLNHPLEPRPEPEPKSFFYSFFLLLHYLNQIDGKYFF
jgi:hypothetical protein